MRRDYKLDPLAVLTLSFRQTLKRVLFWARLTVWRIVFSLPLVTWPAAKAAFYQGIVEGLRDPFDQDVNVRESFVRGFFDHFLRSTIAGVINLAVFAVFLFGILFWAAQEQFWLNLLAGLALPFLGFWWICQPYLYPVLVESPDLPVRQVLRKVVRHAASHPGYSFVTAFTLTWLFVLSLPLVGPLSLLTIPFLALIATQAYWISSGITVPDLIDPVLYAEQREAKKQSQTGGK
jgi:uncharacterized membrane protein YesL